MAIFIDNIELQISSKSYTKINEWLNRGYLKKATELKKNNWNYMIKSDDEIYECVITYSEQSIRSFNCACNQKFQKRACLHIYACALWHKNNIKTKEKQSKTPRLKKIDLEVYSNDLLQDSIWHFFSKEINHNAKLHAAFQLRFFYLESLSAKEVFDTLLPLESNDTTVSKTSISSLKHQIELLNYLYDAAIYCLSNGLSSQSISACMHGLVFSSKIYRTNRNNQAELYIRKFNSLVYELLRSTKEPNLRESNINNALDAIQNNQFNIWFSEENLAQYLYSFYTQKSYKNMITQALINKLSLDIESPSESLINILYCIINNHDDQIVIINFFKKNAKHCYLLDLLFDDVIKINRLHVYIAPLTNLFAHFPEELSENKIDAFIEYYRKNNKIDIAKQYTLTGLYKIQKMKYLDILQSHEDLDIASILNPISAVQYTELRLKILEHCNMTELMVEELSNPINTHYIDQFNKILIKQQDPFILNYYLHICSQILIEFGGLAAYDKIENITKQLKKYSNEKFVLHFMNLLRNKFPERVSLFQNV